MNEAIVVFASYNKGPELEEKRKHIRNLAGLGIDAHLAYLLELTRDGALPKTNVEYDMISNIKEAIHLYKPQVLAFHLGLTIYLRTQEFMDAINSIKKSNGHLTYLLENINHPDTNNIFKKDPDFFEWCNRNFETEHNLYNILWSPKT